MTSKGTITYHLFKGKYDKSENSLNNDYKVEYRIIMDYYSDFGYYMGLNLDFWRSFFKFMHLQGMDYIDLLKGDVNDEVISQYAEKEYARFSNIDDVRDCIIEFSKVFNKTDSTNAHAFFNKINMDSLSLFDDFIEPFFNKQNKKVKKSFLHVQNLDYFDKDYDSSGYEYFGMFEDYFGNRFTKFVDNELEKRNIDEKFSTVDVINSLFSKFSDDFLLSLFDKFRSDMRSLALFHFILISNGEKMFFVLPWRESDEDLTSLEILWTNFLLDSGFNVEIFAFNKSDESLSIFMKRFKENKINLELFDFDGNSKLVINDFKQLQNEITNLNKENTIIKLDGEEVNFDDIYDVFSCTLERQKSGLKMDYCWNYIDFEPAMFPCFYIENYLRNISNVNDGFIYITDDGIVKYDKDKFEDKFNELSKIMKICPFFDYHSNKKVLPKYLKEVNPKTTEGCCLVDDENHSWQWLGKFWFDYGQDVDLDNLWFNEEGSLDFPGFSKMVTVKAADMEVEDRAAEIAFENLKNSKK